MQKLTDRKLNQVYVSAGNRYSNLLKGKVGDEKNDQSHQGQHYTHIGGDL